jgi:glycosyltransferase involved in cell wall biosynthesis
VTFSSVHHTGVGRSLGSVDAREPDISVVLCTRNRCERLQTTLSRFEEVEFDRPWELIVVDNGSSDDTKAVLAEVARHGRLPLRAVSENSPGISRAKNRGLAHARGRIVFFTDDDCYPARDILAAWMEIFADPTIGYAGGRIELFDPRDLQLTVKTDREPASFPPRRLIAPGVMHGASMAFRRPVIDAVGWFDEDLGAGTKLRSGEDSDYLQRASGCGFRGVYSPLPLTWHHHGRTAADIPAMEEVYGIGAGAFYAALLLRCPGTAWNSLAAWLPGGPARLWRGFIRDVRAAGGPVQAVKAFYWRTRNFWRRRGRYTTRGFASFIATKAARGSLKPAHAAASSPAASVSISP